MSAVRCVDVLKEKLPNFIEFGRGLIAKYSIGDSDALTKLELLSKTSIQLAFTMLCDKFAELRLHEVDIEEFLRAEYGDKIKSLAEQDLDKLKRYYELFRKLTSA